MGKNAENSLLTMEEGQRGEHTKLGTHSTLPINLSHLILPTTEGDRNTILGNYSS